MNKHDDPPMVDADNPEWTAADLARAKPISSLPASLRGKLRGRPKLATRKVPVSLRLAPEVVEAYQATGKGWQTAIGETLATTRININEDWEVRYWAQKFGVSAAALRRAVKEAGTLPGTVSLLLRANR